MRIVPQGGFAKVYSVLDMDTQEMYAAKVIAKASLVKRRTKEKVQYYHLPFIQGPMIKGLFGSWQVRSGSTQCSSTRIS